MKGNRKKVLIISPQPFFQWRGSPIRVGFDALALAELGFDVDILTLPIGENKNIPGVRISRVCNPLFIRNIPIGPSLGKAFFDFLLLLKGLRLAAKNRYDFILCIEEAGVIGVIIARLFGAKLIYEKHSDPSSYKKGKARNLVMFMYGRVEKFVARRAASIIGTGPGLVEQVRAMKPRGTVHHIFDIPSSLVEPTGEEVNSRRKELLRSPDETLATYVGSFAVYQGIDVMFEAIPLVAARHPNARFIIIGGSKTEIAQREAYLAQSGVKERVSFLGTIPPDKLPAFLAASDILLSPRIAGVNTPLKLLDYLKAGRAILATDSLANRLILNETCAVLVKPDPESFANGASLLISDAALRDRLGANGRRLIDEQYNFIEFKKKLDFCCKDLENRS